MKTLFAALAVVCLAVPAAQAAEYEIDAAHASIYFKVSHLDVSHVYGRFNDFEGDVAWGETPDDASFDVTIQTASVDTGVPKRDGHLRSPDFFNVQQHPTITFESASVEPMSEDGMYGVTGDFTMNGRTREVTIPMQYHGSTTFRGTEKIGFSGELTIDRTQWGLTAWDGLVGNDVTIMVSFEANKQ